MTSTGRSSGRARGAASWCAGAAADGAISDVTPAGFNARSRVHEYGGGHYAVKDGVVFFINYDDQRLYRQEGAPGRPRRSRRKRTSATPTCWSTLCAAG